MPQLTTEKQIFIVESILKPKVFVNVQRQFGSPIHLESPCKKSIQNNVTKKRNLDKV